MVSTIIRYPREFPMEFPWDFPREFLGNFPGYPRGFLWALKDCLGNSLGFLAEPQGATRESNRNSIGKSL